MKDGRLQLRVDPKLKEKVARLARRRNISLSALVMQLLTEAVVLDQFARQAPHQEVDQI